jgi:hypothetical protein
MSYIVNLIKDSIYGQATLLEKIGFPLNPKKTIYFIIYLQFH